MQAILPYVMVAVVSIGWTCVGAITFNDNGIGGYIFLAGIYLLMAISLAIPFTCTSQRLPFWAAYATATAYALMIRNTDQDVFQSITGYLAYQLTGEVSELHSRPVARIIAYALPIWTPVLTGLLGGTIFATFHLLWTRRTSTG